MVLILVLSLLVVAFLSSSEASLISVNKFRVRHKVQLGNKAAAAVSRVVEKHEKFFATILLTENAFIILASSLGTALTISWLGESGKSVLIATLVMTVVIVTFGEVTPKSLAARASDRWSLVVARPVEIIMAVETVVIYLFTLLPRLVLLLLGGRGKLGSPSITEGELRMLIDMAQAEGVVEPTEAEMLEKVFRFGDRQVQEVMTPRTEIIWVEKGTRLEDFLKLYSRHTHTGFPVYEGDMENVVGILSVKDLMQTMAEKGIQPGDSVTETIRPAYFVPETKLVGQLFSEIRRGGQQMAIVIDQFGGVSGLVTLKSLLEVIVGAMGEEGEPLQEDFEAIGENIYDVDTGMGIQEANEEMGLGLPEGDYQTLAGFVLEHLGHIPQEGEHLQYKELRFEVTKMDRLKIERVQIRVSARSDDKVPRGDFIAT
jgi:CBS domain containing-hemolysin-like protein